MEKESREVVTSKPFDFIDLPSIHEYGRTTFGLKIADYFITEIYASLEDLSTNYLLHPECRHLETKTKKYRNIIFGSYLIIYRITSNRIEVLRAFHCSRSPKSIKESRSIKGN
jgi:plasmid stabilization system protein ParE